MKNFRPNKQVLILCYIIACMLIIPIMASGSNDALNLENHEKIHINPELISVLTSISSVDDVMNPDFGISDGNLDENSIFDTDLRQLLSDCSTLKPQKVKIIIIFEENIEKDHRIDIINSVFEEFEILGNYDIISGTYLSLSVEELAKSESNLFNIDSIKKIYKSQIYDYPYINSEIDSDLPKTNSLSKSSYPNWWIPAIGAENLTYDGTGVRVAVIDTGIFNHPDLNLVMNRSFISTESPLNDTDDYGHGTHVAGIVGSDGGASSGEYRGVAPGVSLISARAGNFSGLEEGDILNAIDWCVEDESNGGAGADIISMSFGGGLPDPNDPMTLAMSGVVNNSVILVASSGNEGSGYFTGSSPASGLEIISVGATDSSDQLASFSSWGPTMSYLGYPDVLAPGVNIIATEAPNSVISDKKRFIGDFFDFAGDADYIPLSGTSMSCPIVSGAIAILKEAYPSITPETAKIALLEGARKVTNEQHEYLKHGAGIINVSASLEYLHYVNATFLDVNNVANIFPDELPIKPYDLLNFPGDQQVFNLTLYSGKAQTLDINIPNKVNGLLLSLDKSQAIFSRAGETIVSLDVLIEHNATSGFRTFILNITDGPNLYDSVEVTIEIRLPDYKILMESYHGLNDWFPAFSYYQIDFYNAMREITNLNISIDYGAQFWTPNYDKNTDNSILTDERVSQYDLIVLQTPILPYSPLEMKNLKNYYDKGGNILFLGTRHNELCVDNINSLFSVLEVNVLVNKETIINENWVGIGASYDSITVDDLTSHELFIGVNSFKWAYGNTFSTTATAEPLAFIDGNEVVTVSDGNSLGKGRLVAFGDSHWLFDDFNLNPDHLQLLSNLMEYFLKDNVSINLALESERTSNSRLNLTIFLRDHVNNEPISSACLNSHLNVSIRNGGYYEEILTTSTSDGIAYNNTFDLPSTSYTPYVINVNITIGTMTYNKSIKLLYYDPTKIPLINSFTVSNPVERTGFSDLDINAQLDDNIYDVTTFMATYTYSYYNTKQTRNDTSTMNNVGFNYSTSYTPDSADPSGDFVVYLIPSDPVSNYINPNSPRILSSIINNPPEFDETKSVFSKDNSQPVPFEDTHDDEYSFLVPASQGSRFDFNISVFDNVTFEDTNSAEMRVSVNLFIVSTTVDGYISIIFPQSFPVSEFSYQATSNSHVGSFFIPFDGQYSSIKGTKSLSTETNYDFNTDEGYLAILMLTVFDSDGASENFIMIISIEAGLILDWTWLLIIGIIVAISITLLIVLAIRRSRKAPAQVQPWADYAPPHDESSNEGQSEETKYRFAYCPYCGYPMGNQKRFCSNCGKSINIVE
ncbi:MAG: S8 family serine peptidase [Promethearchaeota archaeon]